MFLLRACSSGDNSAVGAVLVTERFRVRVPAGVAAGFSSRGSFCADSYFGIRSTPALSQQHVKEPAVLQKVQVAASIVCHHLSP